MHQSCKEAESDQLEREIMQKITIAMAILLLGGALYAKPFKIIARSNPRITTHQLKSGYMTIGLTDNGGGVINQVILPGLGDIMDEATDMYGRAGQVAIRDASHGGRYNPTQAGFYETLGTQCEITKTDGKLIVEPRGMALWHGDRKYDFTEWENIGRDPYGNDGGNGDEDGLDEANLAGKQETEVHSEFDYYGTYEDCRGKHGIAIPVIRHYFELRFIRPPGHALKQFRAGTRLWNADAVREDISINAPEGIHTGTDKDLNGMIAVWSLRHDKKKWTYKFVHYKKKDGTWGVVKDSGPVTNIIRRNGAANAFAIADSRDPTKGVALGLYRPKSDINLNTMVGINEKTGAMVYKDNRTEQVTILVNSNRTPTMSKYGFFGTFTGMINRTRLRPDVYEAFRSEYYILSGTPQEIMDAVKILDATDGNSDAEPSSPTSKP
jgi:hypothetical protein